MFSRKAEYILEFDGKKHNVEAGYGFAGRPYLNVNGEKVDIVRWHEDPIEQLAEALKPAVPQNVNLDRDKRRMYFEVVEDDLSVAIGRKGINARLPSLLWADLLFLHDA